MAANTFHLIIASVGQTVFDGAALSATLPGEDGIFEILPHHEPLVATLKRGEIAVRAGDETKTYRIEHGVLEISGNRAIVLL